MSNVRLYPKVVVERQSFVGVKKCVVPNQSMTLKEILRRFVRREALPVAHEGMYEDRFGDLEKLKSADITVQMERVDEIKSQIAENERKYQERKAKVQADMLAAVSAPPIVPPVGGGPVKSPPPQGA